MLQREEGQALVEAAFVLPAMVFLLLVALQLTQLQQARILADHAAFAAARAGIVMNGDPGKMKDAAVLAVLSGVGPTDSAAAMVKTLVRFKTEEMALGPFGLDQLRVHVHNPVARDFPAWGQHLHDEEIDFDDVRPGATDATLLSLQIRWLYELKVPFANRLLQTIWIAAHRASSAAALSIDDGMPQGLSLGALVAAAGAGRYYLPLQAFYTMRMQSNPYRKWAHP
jgi:TadE-like protein